MLTYVSMHMFYLKAAYTAQGFTMCPNLAHKCCLNTRNMTLTPYLSRLGRVMISEGGCYP